MNEADFIDEASHAVLRVDTFLSWLDADSPAGQMLAASLRPHTARESDEWSRQIDRSRQSERWSHQHPERLTELRDALSNLPKIDRPTRRLQVSEPLDESDFFALKRFLFFASQAVRASAELIDRAADTSAWIERLTRLMDTIHPEKERSPRFHLASRLDSELADARAEQRRIKRLDRQQREELEADLTDEYGGRFDIRGRFRPPAEIETQLLLSDTRLERLETGWSLTSPTLDETRHRLDRANTLVERHETRILDELSHAVAPAVDFLHDVQETLGDIDLELAKCRLKAQISGCWPAWSHDETLRIEAGREIGVLEMLREQPQDIQPIDISLDDRPTVITGPNMGGKSVLLRLVGLCQWAAQHALPVPASTCEITPVNAVVYVGSEEPLADAVAEGLSSFGREVRRLVQWWNRGEQPRLWLLDELGRGTHPEEGAQLAMDIISSLHERGDRCLVATHFPAVAKMEAAKRLRITGITDEDRLENTLAQALDTDAGPGELQDALRASMDYRPIEVDEHDVPRDARTVARALGLELDH